MIETAGPSADDEVVTQARRTLSGVVALMPLLSGFALYWLNEWIPKKWDDPQCGLPNWILIAYVPLLVLPPVFAATRLRHAGKGWRLVVPLVGLASLITLGACMFGFLAWFTRHNCGE